MDKKTCKICKKSLSLDKFYLSHNGAYNFCCIPCDRKRKAVYRLENKEKIALQEHKYKNTERGYMIEVVNGIFNRHKKKNSRLKWVPDCTKQQIYEELMLYKTMVVTVSIAKSLGLMFECWGRRDEVLMKEDQRLKQIFQSIG